MTHRYFVPDLQGHDDIVTLPSEEAHHAVNVMRASIGSELILFDGENRQTLAVIESISKKNIRCRIGPVEIVDRESSRPVVVGVALPKGDRARSAVEKAVELGAWGLVPLQCARSVAVPTEGVIKRLTRYVIDASKQCGRNRLMRLYDPVPWKTFVRCQLVDYVPETELSNLSVVRGFAHPDGTARIGRYPSDAPILLGIGPEGGFTETEVQQALDAGWDEIGLGTRILRVETAVAALLAIAAGQDEAHS